MTEFHIGAQVVLTFGDGTRFDREIEKVRTDGDFKLIGGRDWWRPHGRTARRLSFTDGVASLS